MVTILSQYVLDDIILFLVIGYALLFFLRRINKYDPELNRMILLATIFLTIAEIARLLSILEHFKILSYSLRDIVHISYFISIIGIVFTVVKYVHSIENRYLCRSFQLTTNKEHRQQHSSSFDVGAYAVFSKDRLLDVVEILRDINSPVLVVTRSPKFYEKMKKSNLAILWITQVPDKGIPPTALHVLTDSILRFIRDNPNSIVIIDSTEYLILYNGFKAVFKFLINLKDHIMLMHSTLIVFVDKNTLEEWQASLFLKEFEPL